MEQNSNKIIATNITPSQMKDSGMAFALVCFLVGMLTHSNIWLLSGVGLQLINMVNSKFFHYPAIFWFSLANLLGFVTSKILLTLIFIFVILPMGSIRGLMAKSKKNRSAGKLDTLRLLQWKNSKNSVFKTRNYIFTKKDISNPY